MPLRSDPSLWWNLPDIIAAYQPVRAPDSLSARHNMARGGDSRYRAEPGVLPTWSGVAGWGFDGSTMYLDTGIVGLPATGSWIVSCADVVTGGILAASPFGVSSIDPESRSTVVLLNFYGAQLWANTSVVSSFGSPLTGGVFAASDRDAFQNGVAVGTMNAAGPTITDKTIFIGAASHAISGIAYPFPGRVMCLMLTSATLTPAQAGECSRQMAYCHVNPDWSVWSPARRYYFAPSATVFNPAWAERANRLIGGG